MTSLCHKKKVFNYQILIEEHLKYQLDVFHNLIDFRQQRDVASDAKHQHEKESHSNHQVTLLKLSAAR